MAFMAQVRLSKILAIHLNEIYAWWRALRHSSTISEVFSERSDNKSALEFIIKPKYSMIWFGKSLDFSVFIRKPHLSRIDTFNKKSCLAPSALAFKIKISSRYIIRKIPSFLSKVTTGLRILVNNQGAEERPNARHGNWYNTPPTPKQMRKHFLSSSWMGMMR